MYIPVGWRQINIGNDKNAEKIPIEVPRYYGSEKTDLSEYAMYLKTVSEGGRDDILLSPEIGENTLSAVWTLRPPQTSFCGPLFLQLRFEGEDFKWETSISQIEILPSADARPVVPVSPSAYEGWLSDMQSVADSVLDLTVSAESLPSGAEASVEKTVSSDVYNLHFKIPQGEQGETGTGIASVAKTSTSGNVDTYTITMTDGSTSTFTVTNTNILGETSATKTAIGSDAAPDSTGNSVVAVGRTALYALTTGAQNVAVGAGAAGSVTTGQSNTVIGAAANTAAATTNYGTAVGRTAVTGADSVAIGANAKASGAYGTAVGYGTEVTASRGTAIGAGTKANFAGSVAIGQDSSGNSATASANNEMVIGTAAHKVKIPGTLYDGKFKASIPNPTYGEELAPALSSWTGTNATYSDGKWTVVTGGTISTTIECEAEADYLIKLTERIDGVLVNVENAVTPNETPKPCTISLGSASLSIFGANDANWQVVLQPTAGGSLTLTIGGGEWSGTIPYVSVKKITSYANAALNVQEYYVAMPSGSVAVGNGFTKQGVTVANNVAVGYHSQENAQSGIGNVGVGLYTQQNIKNGSHNVAVGESAQRYLETGMYNFAVGYSAQSKLKSGCWNVAMGNEAQRDLTTGCNNVSLGRRAHNNITTGNKNVAIGAQAGFVRATNPDNPDVTTEAYATKTGAEQVLIGFQATQTQNSQGTADGAIAIGARAMANTDGIAIGRDTKAGAAGSVAIGKDSQGNSAHADNANDFVLGTENHRIILAGKIITFNADHTVTWEDINA